MIDLSHLEQYKENNRIEAKKASGGLPKSLWETYSSFSNTLGGVILLGVEEQKDKSFFVSGLEDPEGLVKDFWDNINNTQKVNVNILTDKNICIEEISGKRIIVLHVPRAERADRPVFIGGNPLTGTYRRNGEGDYRCSHEQVRAMLRDAAVKSQDMLVLEEMGLDVFDYESIRRYRIRMKSYRPGHVWEELEDAEFLYKLGAVGRGSDGGIHPTAAGLLMFGHEYEIVKEYPDYFLDYQEKFDSSNRWTDRIVSSSGDWSGNLYDFYFRVYNKVSQNIKVPFKIENGARVEDTPVHKALREAVANCLIHADYYGKRGVVVIQTKEEIMMCNPGNFRIELEAARAGGVSDPRNVTLMKMFNLIDIGERAGSGIPNIYSVWDAQGWEEPGIVQEFEPDRVVVMLKIEGEEKSATKIGDKNRRQKSAIKIGDKNRRQKSATMQKNIQRILDYLTEYGFATSLEIATAANLRQSRIRDYLRILTEEGLVVPRGGKKNRVYGLADVSPDQEGSGFWGDMEAPGGEDGHVGAKKGS